MGFIKGILLIAFLLPCASGLAQDPAPPADAPTETITVPAEFIEWRGIKINPHVIAEIAIRHKAGAKVENWGQISSVREKLTAFLTAKKLNHLFTPSTSLDVLVELVVSSMAKDDPDDSLQDLLPELLAYSTFPDPVKEQIEVAIPTIPLDPAAETTKTFQARLQTLKFDVLYRLIDKSSFSRVSIHIFGALASKVASSSSIDEVVRFIAAFPYMNEADAEKSHLYQLHEDRWIETYEAGNHLAALALINEYVEPRKESVFALSASQWFQTILFDLIATRAGDLSKEIPGKEGASIQDRIEICDVYIRSFPQSSDQVRYTQDVAIKLQREYWDRQRLKIKKDDPDATNKISILLLSVYSRFQKARNRANELLDVDEVPLTGALAADNPITEKVNEAKSKIEGEDLSTLSEIILLQSVAERHRNYFKYLLEEEKLAEQFEGNPKVADETQLSLVARDNDIRFYLLELLVKQIEKQIVVLSEKQEKIVASVDELKATFSKEITALGDNLGTKLDGIAAGLNRIDASIKKMDKNLGSKIDQVNGHLTGIKAELKTQTEEYKKTADEIRKLSETVRDEFAKNRKAISDAAKGDITNGAFWHDKGNRISNWYDQNIGGPIKGLFSFLFECQGVYGDVLLSESGDINIPLVRSKYASFKEETLGKFSDSDNFLVNLTPPPWAKRGMTKDSWEESDETTIVNERSSWSERTLVEGDYHWYDSEDNKREDQGDSAWRMGNLLICQAIERDNAGCQATIQLLADCWEEGMPKRHPSVRKTNDFSRDNFWPQLAGMYLAYIRGNDVTRKSARELADKFATRLKEHDWNLTDHGNEASFHANALGGRYIVMATMREMGIRKLWDDQSIGGKAGFETYKMLWFTAARLKAIEVYGNVNLAAIPDVFSGDAEPGDILDEPSQYYSYCNMFWEVLLVKMTDNPGGLDPLICRLSRAGEDHNMMLFRWLRGNRAPTARCLESWPEEWNTVEYVWQRSKKQQEGSRGSKKLIPRLDYMVLAQLQLSGLEDPLPNT